MKPHLLLFLLPVYCYSQAINCGGRAVDGFQDDFYFTGGAAFSKSALGPPPNDTMRFGPSFSYRIPKAHGVYTVALVFVEPSYTTPGKRLITVDVNGQRVTGVDPFALSRSQMHPFASVLITALAGTGSLNITLTSEVAGGNAVLSAIVVNAANPFLGFQLGSGFRQVLIEGSGAMPQLNIDGSVFNAIVSTRSPGPTGDCTASLMALVTGNPTNSFPRPFAVIAIDSFVVCGPDPAGADKWVFRTIARW